MRMKLFDEFVTQGPRRRRLAGLTLAEVVVALSLTGLAVGGIVSGYAFCTRSAEKAALTLAANARALERIEQTRCAKWDLSGWPELDELVSTNFPVRSVALDLSGTGQEVTKATVLTEIALVSTNPPLKRIRVHCLWPFQGVMLTNTLETYRAPDQ
jgi:hypothetical protein